MAGLKTKIPAPLIYSEWSFSPCFVDGSLSVFTGPYPIHVCVPISSYL